MKLNSCNILRTAYRFYIEICSDIGVVAITCDMVAAIYAGTIVEYGTKEQII